VSSRAHLHDTTLRERPGIVRRRPTPGHGSARRPFARGAMVSPSRHRKTCRSPSQRRGGPRARSGHASRRTRS